MKKKSGFFFFVLSLSFHHKLHLPHPQSLPLAQEGVEQIPEAEATAAQATATAPFLLASPKVDPLGIKCS